MGAGDVHALKVRGYFGCSYRLRVVMNSDIPSAPSTGEVHMVLGTPPFSQREVDFRACGKTEGL